MSGKSETLIEWGVRIAGAPTVWMVRSHYYDLDSGILTAAGEGHAIALAAAPETAGAIVSRQRTLTVTDWIETKP